MYIEGSDAPSYNHKREMPLLSSFLDEIQRMKPVAPLAVLHETTDDLKIKEHYVKKGMTVIY